MATKGIQWRMEWTFFRKEELNTSPVKVKKKKFFFAENRNLLKYFLCTSVFIKIKTNSRLSNQFIAISPKLFSITFIVIINQVYRSIMLQVICNYKVLIKITIIIHRVHYTFTLNFKSPHGNDAYLQNM